VRLTLFVSSYAPLLALFAILDSFGRGWPSQLCASLSGASVVVLLALWVAAGRGAGDWLRLRESRNRDADVMGYFVSYVIPFAAVGTADTRTKIALAAFALIVAALYLRAAVFYIHPLLLLVGVHVYDAVTDDGSPVTVLTTRRFLRQDSPVWVTAVGQSVYREVAPR
jgi:hypothetical protein